MGIHVTVPGRFLDDAGKVHRRLAAVGGHLQGIPVAIVDQANFRAAVREHRRRSIGPNRCDDVAVPAQPGDQPAPEMPVGAGNEDAFEHANNDSKV